MRADKIRQQTTADAGCPCLVRWLVRNATAQQKVGKQCSGRCGRALWPATPQRQHTSVDSICCQFTVYFKLGSKITIQFELYIPFIY